MSVDSATRQADIDPIGVVAVDRHDDVGQHGCCVLQHACHRKIGMEDSGPDVLRGRDSVEVRGVVLGQRLVGIDGL